MAGDVQHPFSLSFQVEALHSSSISFGRFDLESLSWERRSSFSHNRYLEDVEKYAKRGCVTEKKAYFEAHFKKRALLRQASSISQAEREASHSDSSSYDTSICEDNHGGDSVHVEKPREMVRKCDVCHFDESPKGSSVFECEAGIVNNLQSESLAESLPSVDDTIVKCSSLEADFSEARSTDRLELKQELNLDTPCTAENVKCNENEETRESESTEERVLMFNDQKIVDLGSEFNEQTLDVQKGQCISGSTARGPINQRSVVHTRPRTSESIGKIRSRGLRSRPHGDALLAWEGDVKKVIHRTNDWREKQTSMRVAAQKQIQDCVARTPQSTVRPSKENPQNLKPKSSHEKNSTENDSRPKRAVTPQPERSFTPQSKRAVTPQPKRAVTPQPKRAVTLQPKRTVTPQPSTPDRSESRRHQSTASSTMQITSTRKEMGHSAMNTSFRSTGGPEKKRDKIRAADIRQISKNPLGPVSKPGLLLSSREKPQVVASNTSPATTSTKTFQSEKRTTTPSNSCSASRVKKVVSSSKSAGTHFPSSLEARSNGSLSTRSHVKEAIQKKEVLVVRREAKPDERKQKAREHGHGFLRKSMGHSSAGVRNSVTVTETPKLGPVRAGNPFLRRSMGH